MPEKTLLQRMRAVIDRPSDFSDTDVSAVLTDAGEVIVMLKRIIAKHVRENVPTAGATESL